MNTVYEISYQDRGKFYSLTVVANSEQANRVAELLGGKAAEVVGWCPEFEALEIIH